MNASQFLGAVVQLQIDRPLGSCHPEHGFIYPVNYGYVPGTMAPDGEALDAYVLGVVEAVESFSGRCIAIIHRLDDDDGKLVIAPDGIHFSDDAIREATHFQEQFFQSALWRAGAE